MSWKREWRAVLEMTPRTSGPRFFNHLFAGRQPQAAVVEMVSALLNNSMYTYKAAGPQIFIERIVTQRMRQLAGYGHEGSGDGTTVPGGSIGNLIALLLARNHIAPATRNEGMTGPPMTVYTSAEGHYSIKKAAGILGIGRHQVREIETDSSGRLRIDTLERQLQEDRAAGFRPICVVGTAGTTVRGEFDPLEELARVAREESLWFHVDGAFGASLLLHREKRTLLEGIEHSDSFCWCAHKMMGVPLHCSFLLVRDDQALYRNLDEAADYLYQQDQAELNPGRRSIQCGRRNDVFKVWAAWQALGDEGWHARLERQLALASCAAEKINQEDRFELVQEPRSINICFFVKALDDAATRRLCEELNRRGLAHVSFGVINGRTILRLVTANPDLNASDLDRFFAAVLTVADELD